MTTDGFKFSDKTSNVMIFVVKASEEDLIIQGWLGNERKIRIYFVDNDILEIRIYNKDDSSYCLHINNSPIDCLKVEAIYELAKQYEHTLNKPIKL